MKKYLFTINLILCLFILTDVQSQVNDWSAIEVTQSIEKTTELAKPSNFTLHRLNDYDNVFNKLLLAPERFNQGRVADVIFSLPMPDGGFNEFRVLDAPVMAPELAAQFSDNKSYTLIGITNRQAIAKIDFGPKGFHAMIRISGESTVFIDPYRLEDHVYMTYRKKDYPTPTDQFICHVEADDESVSERRMAGDCSFREYRLALACTGEYAQFHGGTVAGVNAAFTVSMNRVNGVFEDEAGITMKIVAGNNGLIFLDGSTDPYTNGSGSTMLGQNQTTCDNVIGSANYDIGHVFSTGGGGVASLRSPCNNNRKARGVTGRGAPVGDPFDIDYVAHEMGHQYGGNHTQNNSCNRTSQSYEPGSASTIMGYAGICAPNVQSNSDAYYHAASLAEFGAFLTNGSQGGACDNILSSANNAPTADAGSNYTIPRSTAFELIGVGSDPDGDPITYCWEQFDNTPSTQPPSSSSTNGPNFRSLIPSIDPGRQFPALGLPNTWEVLSAVSRTFNFRLTVRDKNMSFGYGCTDEDDMQVMVNASAGPFSLTSANGGETWASGGVETVTWNVAGTNVSPIFCTQVDILLSIDGGLTYPFTLATNVANDGSETVVLPHQTTTDARLKIRSVGNIFFDVSDNTFIIEPNEVCITYTSNDVPIAITSASSGTYFSDLIIADIDNISRIEVVDIEGLHSNVGDLTFSLLNPAGMEVTLVSIDCSTQADFDMGFMDDAAMIACPLDQQLVMDPVGSLADFAGFSRSGTWRLKIVDGRAPNGGSLNGWGLNICLTNGSGNCDNTLTFDSTPIASGTYYAANSIDASVELQPAAEVIFQAGIKVELDGGFDVPLGAEFDALIGGCP